jgi:hypothetical protein
MGKIDEKLAALEAKMVSSKRVKVKRKAVKHAYPPHEQDQAL